MSPLPDLTAQEVALMTIQGQPPIIPSYCPEQLRVELQSCFAYEPSQRPKALELFNTIKSLIASDI
jgi:hypothetical protein